MTLVVRSVFHCAFGKGGERVRRFLEELRAPPSRGARDRYPLFTPLLVLNGNRQRADRRRGSAPQLQRRSYEQELIHLILRQVFQP